MNEPIDYDEALRDLLRKQRQRRITGLIRQYSDLRPRSHGQLMLIGIGIAIIGGLVPVVHFLVTAGLTVLLFGFFTGILQPRGRKVTWRNREIDLPPEDNWGHRFYRAIYRRRP